MDEPLHVRYCPACREEYQPHMTHCLECGGALEDRIEGESSKDEPPETQASLPPGDYRRIADGLSSPTVTRLVGRFIAAGIPVKVESVGYGLTLSARVEELTAALSILEGQGVVPRQPDASEPVIASEGGPCPACGTVVAPGTNECPECGLLFGETPVCQSCGEELASADETCPSCGQSQD